MKPFQFKSLKSLLAVLFVAVFQLVAYGQTYNMSNGSVSTCCGTFYDSGGAGGNYGNGENFVYTICPGTSGQAIRLDFSSFQTQITYDQLKIYDGNSTGAPLIGTYQGATNPGTITATNATGCITFSFQSNGSFNQAGWAASISCVPLVITNQVIMGDGSVSTCDGFFYDSGGPGNGHDSFYQNDEDYTLTICPDNGGFLTMDFTFFKLPNPLYGTGSEDYLEIYDGNSTGGVYLGKFDKTNIPGLITATNPSGCLTFIFHSDGNLAKLGWEATIGCIVECEVTVAPETAADCDGPSTSIITDYDNTLTYTFSPAGPVINSGTGVITGTDGTYTVTVTDGACSDDATFTIDPQLANTTPTFDPIDDICEGGSATALPTTSTNGIDGTWSPATIDNTAIGKTTYTFTPNPGGCVTEFELNIIVSPKPNFSGTSGSPDPICLGDEAVFTGVATPVTVDNICAEPNFPPMALPDGDGVVVSYENSLNIDCYAPGQELNSIADLLSICVNMEHTQMGDLTIAIECPSGEIINLHNQGGGQTRLGIPVQFDDPPVAGTGWDYCWSATATNGTWVDNQNPYHLLPAGTYESIDNMSGLVGCDLNGDWTIIITDHNITNNGFLFDWSLNFDPAIMPAPEDLTPNITSEGWKPDPTIVSGTNPITVKPTTTGDACYTYEVTDDYGCTYDTTVCITVNPKPADPTFTPTAPTCDDNSSAQIDGFDDATFNYSISSNNASIDASGEITGDPGTYSVTVENGDGCESSADVTIEEQLAAPTVGTDVQTACGPYTWIDGVEYTADNNTATHTLTAESGCDSIVTLDLTINSSVTGTDVQTACGPYTWIDGVEYTASNNTATFTLTAANGCDSIVTLDLTINNSVTGTDTQVACGPYTWIDGVEYTADNNTATHTLTAESGCDSIVTLDLTINTPTIDNISSTDASCNTDDGTITVSASGEKYPLSYSLDNGQTSNDGTFTDLDDGSYVATVTDASGCETNQTLTVGKASGPTLTIENSENVTCFGENDGSAEVDATGGTSTYTYDWSPVGGNNATASSLVSGIYTVTVKDDKGCSDAVEITISEPDSLSIDETITNSNCDLNNGEIALNVTGGTGNYTYYWFPNVSSTDKATALENGTYEITVTDDNGCFKVVSYTIIQMNSFNAEAHPDSTTIEQGENVDLNVFVDPNATVDNITWTPAEGLSCWNCINPVATPENSTTYFVEVTNEDGCISIDSVKINVYLPCGDIFVPNTFSPNSDGLNDLHCVMGDCILTLDFSIFNRWGEMVFQTFEQKECWDGTFRGEYVQSGVYVYKLKATLQDGSNVDRTGNVTIVR